MDSKMLWATSMVPYKGDDDECMIKLECTDDEGNASTHIFRMYQKTLTAFCAKEAPKPKNILKSGANFGASGLKEAD